MPFINSWPKRPHLSIEGLEVVPATGLEVAFDSSPEVASAPHAEKEIANSLKRPRRTIWRRKLFGIPLLWIGISVTLFAVGIAIGGIITSIVTSRGNSSKGNSSFQSLSPTASSSSAATLVAAPSAPSSNPTASISTTPSPTLSSSPSSISVSTATPATSGSTIADVNLQTFTGALGGIAAEPVTPTNDTTRPFQAGAGTFTDLLTAITRSCNDQHNACAQFENENKESQITLGDCDTQQTNCFEANSSTS